jgi:branched-chain amino acid transport system substrate-binding protein
VISRANELLTQGVSVIIEGWNSPVALAMQPVISRAGILDITALLARMPFFPAKGILLQYDLMPQTRKVGLPLPL